jgi:hypothetical protein
LVVLESTLIKWNLSTIKHYWQNGDPIKHPQNFIIFQCIWRAQYEVESVHTVDEMESIFGKRKLIIFWDLIRLASFFLSFFSLIPAYIRSQKKRVLHWNSADNLCNITPSKLGMIPNYAAASFGRILKMKHTHSIFSKSLELFFIPFFSVRPVDMRRNKI